MRQSKKPSFGNNFKTWPMNWIIGFWAVIIPFVTRLLSKLYEALNIYTALLRIMFEMCFWSSNKKTPCTSLHKSSVPSIQCGQHWL